MKFILALDQGTTSSRALVFDHDGVQRAVAQQEIRQIFPQPGWVEHDAEEIWSTQLAVARDALSRAGITAREVAAIGISNQRETTVLWDRVSGKPVHNAIVWQDRRTAAACDALIAAGHQSLIEARTGLVPDPYFSATKLAWLLDNVSGARARAEAGELAFGTIDSWLIWNLTGGKTHITDASNAARTLLFDIHRGDWDGALLKLFAIPRALLPEVVASSAQVALTDASLFGAAIPIAGIAGDQQAALFGQRCIEPGMVKNTYGTGCFMLMHTGDRPVQSNNKLLTTTAWRINGRDQYALEGSVFVAGAAVQWLRDGLGIIKNSSDVEALAASVADNGGVYCVPAFTGLGSPHWNPHARGTLTGLTRGSTAAHIARATLESIAFQTADVLRAMEADAGSPLTELRVDGGAARNALLMQFQADLLGVPVICPEQGEITALGAAYLAGLGVGYWNGASDIDSRNAMSRRYEPAMSRDQADQHMAEWNRALAATLSWADDAANTSRS